MAYVLGSSAAEQDRLKAQRELYGDTIDLKFQGHESVVEIGCGPFVNSWIAEQAGSYMGVDIQPAQITAASKFASELGITNASFEVASAERTGLPIGSYDAVFIRCLLVHLSNPLAVLVEARRLLKPGGRLIVIEPDDRSVYAGPNKDALIHCWRLKTTYATVKNGTSPNVVRQIYPMLVRAGFMSVDRGLHCVHATGREPERCIALMKNWLSMIERVAPGLIGLRDLELARAEASSCLPETFATLNMWRALAIK